MKMKKTDFGEKQKGFHRNLVLFLPQELSSKQLGKWQASKTTSQEEEKREAEFIIMGTHARGCRGSSPATSTLAIRTGQKGICHLLLNLAASRPEKLR